MNLKKATTILLLCTFVILVVALSGCNYTKEYLTQINYETLKSKINNKDSFVLYVGNKSCPHCKDFQPKFQSVINKYKITVYKLDTATLTTDEFDELRSLIGQTGTPTVMFFYEGTESGTGNRINGDVENSVIIERLKANDLIKD